MAPANPLFITNAGEAPLHPQPLLAFDIPFLTSQSFKLNEYLKD
jgi:hypothetical protein